jgi:hypothetical protein
MIEPTITCPNCKTGIKLTESLTAETESGAVRSLNDDALRAGNQGVG